VTIQSSVSVDLQQIFVNAEALGLEDGPRFIPAYWYGVVSIPGRQLGCHVMLENGANWTRVPIKFLRTKCDFTPEYVSEKLVQPWDCFGYTVEYQRFPFLRDMRVKLLDRKTAFDVGRYMFTLDWTDPNGNAPFAEFPEQHKQAHVIACDDGTIRLRPNNMLRWIDSALFDLSEPLPRYKAISKIYRGES